MYVFIYVILSYRIYYLNIALFAIRNIIFLYRFDNTTLINYTLKIDIYLFLDKKKIILSFFFSSTRCW